MLNINSYQTRKQRYQTFLDKLDRSFNRFVYLKLIVLISGLTSVAALIINRKYPIASGAFLLGTFLLIYLDIGHRKVICYREYASILRDINEQSTWRLDGRWHDFQDNGHEYRDDSHPFTSDLDIFGPGSLFQWVNTTRTYLGRQKLHGMLTSPPDSIPAIHERQTAIAELAQCLSWRQRYLTYGTVVSDKMRDPGFLFEWVNDHNRFILQKPVVFALRVLPVITISLIAIYFATHRIPSYIPVLAVLTHVVLLKIGSKKRTIILTKAGEYDKNLQVYADLIRHILKKNFNSVYLRRLKGKLFNRNKKSADFHLRTLSKIVDSIANRNNVFFVVVNIIMLWDFQWLIALERWKNTCGGFLKSWLETVGEFEALSSLAIIAYDHPDWATPIFNQGVSFINAEKLGHPLISDTARVPNPLQIGKQVRVLLITGSNMSGKSTYLRTAGINLVLAYTGAPVCAASFRCALLNIHTCMRVADNLEKNTSTFYAEILRIKLIVEASGANRPIFFLLDEIFKGTNSLDRHTGAKMLIKKLILNGAIGLVSTHDLELGELEKELQTVKNYHFIEEYLNDKLHFHYRLYPGISTTRNALYLMKAAGVTDDQD